MSEPIRDESAQIGALRTALAAYIALTERLLPPLYDALEAAREALGESKAPTKEVDG